MYGLLHCLSSSDKIASVVALALSKTNPGGHHIVAVFNDGPHDLSAHPGFTPTLLPHAFYRNVYRGQRILFGEADTIYETHPHNKIPHFHSLTRLVVEKLQ
jgi:hypothetical protein